MAVAKILVVDDDPAVRNLIQRFLLKQNYQVESAEDGKTGVSMFEQFNPDLVILDVNLPDVIGFNLCQEMFTPFHCFLTSHGCFLCLRP